MRQGSLDRRVRFLRGNAVDDGYSFDLTWSDDLADDYLGLPVWAAKADVSDGERIRSAEIAATISTRFTVRQSSFTDTITPKDRLLCDGKVFEIVGIKEKGGRGRYLEISALARIDR